MHSEMMSEHMDAAGMMDQMTGGGMMSDAMGGGTAMALPLVSLGLVVLLAIAGVVAVPAVLRWRFASERSTTPPPTSQPGEGDGGFPSVSD